MLQTLLNKILLGNTDLAGIRTIIVNSILLIIGLWDYLDKEGGLFDMLCTSFQWMCNVSESQFYIAAVVVITALNNILRWLTVAPVGVTTNPAQVRMATEGPADGKKAFAMALIYGSIGVIAFMIIRAFV